MKIHGISLVEGSHIANATVATGTTFPNNPNEGELFYKTGEGLYIHNGTSWHLISVGGLIGHVHQQTTPASTWNITHNFGTTNIQITVYVIVGSDLVVAFPSNITHTNTTTEITFTQSHSGKAVLVAVK